MKLNRTIKKITSLFFAALVISSVFAAFVTPVVTTPEPTPGTITIKGLRISETVICATELAALPVVTREVTLVRRGGRITNMTVTGPLFDTVLRERFGINQAYLTDVRFAALDGYSINFHPEILQNRDIILAYLINNTAFTEGDEYWPIRIIVPDEMGLYWVRMLTTIEIINGTHVPVKPPVRYPVRDSEATPPVVPPTPVSITVIPASVTHSVTENITFTAKVLPEGANQSVTWSVDNVTGNGTINVTGFFTAISAGTVNVTATSVVDANIAGNATVTVILPAPTAITVSPKARTLNVTENVTFIATVLPREANQSVLWSVTNATVGTINETGFFRAISAGTVNVTARSVVDRTIARNATVTVPPVVEPPVDPNKFIADGGSSLVPVAKRLGEILTERTGVKVFVNETTTSRGIRAAGEGRANIGMGGRDLRDTELAEFPDLKSVQIAKEGVAFIVHPGNPVDSLTIGEIRKIFSGEIKNWNQIGGKDAEITIVTRQPGAGLRDMMVDIIMKEVKICETAIIKYSTWDARNFISNNDFAIGFVGTAAVDETVRSIKVNGVVPTDENIQLGSYPITRIMYFYTLGKPDALEQQFINLTLSDEGQAIIEEYGFISIINVAYEPVVPPTPAPRIPGFGIIATILGILGAILILFKEKN